MGIFEMIVAIVAIGVTAELLKNIVRLKSQRRVGDDQLVALNGRLDRIEHRLANIETILVDQDGSGSLHRQFEALERNAH